MTRVAVVTGAARGIGAAVAAALAADGWALALGDACADDPALTYPLGSLADLTEVAGRCRALGVEVAAQPCDVRGDEDVARLVAAAAGLGEVEAGVACAGVLGGMGSAWRLDEATLQRDLAVNYLGVAALARAVVPHLLAAGDRGRFVAVVSAGATRGLPLLASYVASKAAALGYVRSLAADLAPAGVTANAVLPGSTDTDLLAATAAGYGLDSPAEFAGQQRSGRLLRPAEVAGAVAWLCSAATTGVTGAAIAADGGFHG